jgi:hypothetical protein
MEEIIQAKTKELKELQWVEGSVDLGAENALKDEIHALLEQEDLKWKQWAKETWLKNGDRITKFFHACANQRARRNMISKITDIRGKDCDAQEVEKAFVEYYHMLFTSSLTPNEVDYTYPIKQTVTNMMA